jgi:hypothetical protein
MRTIMYGSSEVATGAGRVLVFVGGGSVGMAEGNGVSVGGRIVAVGLGVSVGGMVVKVGGGVMVGSGVFVDVMVGIKATIPLQPETSRLELTDRTTKKLIRTFFTNPPHFPGIWMSTVLPMTGAWQPVSVQAM